MCGTQIDDKSSYMHWVFACVSYKQSVNSLCARMTSNLLSGRAKVPVGSTEHNQPIFYLLTSIKQETRRSALQVR